MAAILTNLVTIIIHRNWNTKHKVEKMKKTHREYLAEIGIQK